MDIRFLGTSIKQNRKRLHLTQEVLAEKLDVSTHYIYELERGTRLPSIPLLINIAELFNVTIDSLFIETLPKNNIDVPNDKLSNLVDNMPLDKRENVYDILSCLMPYLKL